jgi:Flp pilus assembly protein TadG
MEATKRRRRIHTGNERGNAFIELALVSLIMIPVLFGVMDYSRVFYYASVAQGAARAGTQYAILTPPNHFNTTGMQSAATADASNVTTAQNFTPVAQTVYACAGSSTMYSSAPSCGSSEMYVYAQVNTSLTFTTLFQYPFLPSALTVNGKSIMRVQ